MIGLIVLFVIGVYLTISVFIVLWGIRFAKRKGRSPWLGGILAALVMYNLVFWDLIPVYVNHHHLCKEHGGFWIYKTPELWFRENPDAIGEKWGDKWNAIRYETVNGISRTWHSEYLYSESNYDRNYAHAIRKGESRLIDSRTGVMLARVVDFERGGGNFLVHADSITDYKFWLGMGENDCRKDGESCQQGFSELITKYKLIGGIRDGK